MSQFWKMNGAGNDFVVFDNRDQSLDFSKEKIAQICNRQRGVGGDGLLMVEPAQNGAADFRMRYYNADGGEAEMCGNGARCFARFVNLLNDNQLETTSFETIAGVIGAEFFGDEVRIELSEPFDQQTGVELDLDGEQFTVHSINTGVPHAVVFVDDLEKIDIVRFGSAIRYHQHFSPAGTNANFVEKKSDGSIAIRTYERGVEGETLACGTGMVACAIFHHELNGASTPVQVSVAGGETLEVGFQKNEAENYQKVTLLGPAQFTFEGSLA